MQISFLLVRSLLIAAPFALFEIFVDKLLIKQGYVRPGKKIWSILLGTYLAILLKELMLADIPWWIAGSFIVLGSIFSSNRYDLNQSFRKGKWWWVPKNKKTENANRRNPQDSGTRKLERK